MNRLFLMKRETAIKHRWESGERRIITVLVSPDLGCPPSEYDGLYTPAPSSAGQCDGPITVLSVANRTRVIGSSFKWAVDDGLKCEPTTRRWRPR